MRASSCALCASVGRGGVNQDEDVRLVEALLDRRDSEIGQASAVRTPARLRADGECDARTIARIEQFQRDALGVAHPSGRVDPGDATIAALSSPPTSVSLPPPASSSASDGARARIVGGPLPAPASRVLIEILDSAGVRRVEVVLRSRSVVEYAAAAYDEAASIAGAGVDGQTEPASVELVEVVRAHPNAPRDEVVALLADRIHSVGASAVSSEIDERECVFEVKASSVPRAQHPAFLAAIRAHADVTRVVAPPSAQGFRISIPRDTPAERG